MNYCKSLEVLGIVIFVNPIYPALGCIVAWTRSTTGTAVELTFTSNPSPEILGNKIT